MFKFGKQSEATKNKVVVILCCALGALYFGLWYPVHSKDVEFKQSMVKRSLNRMQTRTSAVKMPNVSVKSLESKLTDLEKELQETDARLAEMKARFMPLDGLENLQAMRLEINQLAAESRVNVAEMAGPAHRGSDGSLPSIEAVMKRETDNSYGRPLVVVVATATYEGLLRFTQGLNSLPYNASIVRLDVAATSTDGGGGAPQLLDVTFQIAM